MPRERVVIQNAFGFPVEVTPKMAICIRAIGRTLNVYFHGITFNDACRFIGRYRDMSMKVSQSRKHATAYNFLK